MAWYSRARSSLSKSTIFWRVTFVSSFIRNRFARGGAGACLEIDVDLSRQTLITRIAQMKKQKTQSGKQENKLSNQTPFMLSCFPDQKSFSVLIRVIRG